MQDYTACYVCMRLFYLLCTECSYHAYSILAEYECNQFQVVATSTWLCTDQSHEGNSVTSGNHLQTAILACSAIIMQILEIAYFCLDGGNCK